MTWTLPRGRVLAGRDRADRRQVDGHAHVEFLEHEQGRRQDDRVLGRAKGGQVDAREQRDPGELGRDHVLANVGHLLGRTLAEPDFLTEVRGQGAGEDRSVVELDGDGSGSTLATRPADGPSRPAKGPRGCGLVSRMPLSSQPRTAEYGPL